MATSGASMSSFNGLPCDDSLRCHEPHKPFPCSCLAGSVLCRVAFPPRAVRPASPPLPKDIHDDASCVLRLVCVVVCLFPVDGGCRGGCEEGRSARLADVARAGRDRYLAREESPRHMVAGWREPRLEEREAWHAIDADRDEWQALHGLPQ